MTFAFLKESFVAEGLLRASEVALITEDGEGNKENNNNKNTLHACRIAFIHIRVPFSANWCWTSIIFLSFRKPRKWTREIRTLLAPPLKNVSAVLCSGSGGETETEPPESFAQGWVDWHRGREDPACLESQWKMINNNQRIPGFSASVANNMRSEMVDGRAVFLHCFFNINATFSRRFTISCFLKKLASTLSATST